MINGKIVLSMSLIQPWIADASWVTMIGYLMIELGKAPAEEKSCSATIDTRSKISKTS